jgi:hypothetical protein
MGMHVVRTCGCAWMHGCITHEMRGSTHVYLCTSTHEMHTSAHVYLCMSMHETHLSTHVYLLCMSMHDMHGCM